MNAGVTMKKKPSVREMIMTKPPGKPSRPITFWEMIDICNKEGIRPSDYLARERLVIRAPAASGYMGLNVRRSPDDQSTE